MSDSFSAEQVRERNISAMGRELGELFTLLSSELTWAFWKWSQYTALYAGKATRLDILNASAPFFFWVIQQTLWFETLLGIARLAGPETTGKKQNLSIRRIPALIVDGSLRTETDTLLREVIASSSFAMDWRNRHIAHRDLDLSLGKQAIPLPEASRVEVDRALDAMAALLNRVDAHFFRSTTAYRSSPLTWDAESLLHVLRDGLKREELRTKRLEQGEYRPEDWNDDAEAI